MASVEEGLLSSPQLLNREEVPDVFQRAGFVSPGLRYLHLEKDCFPRRAVGQKISHFTESKCDLPISAQARLCPPVLGQMAAIGALDTPDEYFEAVKEEYIKRRDFMINGLNRIEGVFTPLPMGAFYTIAELPVDDTEAFAKWMLESFRIDNETTMVTPAASFYKTPGKGKNHARIAYVLEVDEMKKALHILEEGLKAYPGRTI